MNNTKYCLLTNDVETTSIWLNTLRDETGWKVYREGMPILLDIYERYGVKSTFYFTGYIAKLIPDIVKMIQGKGHEIGSHGLSHIKKNGFDVMPFQKQKEHLEITKKLLEDISGEEVISFRAPALRVNEHTARALIETGHKIDSSIASQRFDMFMSFGGLKKLKWLTAPRLPYHVSEESIFKKGNSPLVEIPLSATLFPYVGTTLRIFPAVSNLQKRLLSYETSLNGKPIVFDIHPNEFIDESDLPRQIDRRSNNPISYLLQDFLRSKLKVKNLGKECVPLYENQIDFFKWKNFQFTTVRDYCIQNKLINE
jgi:peptidoglycan-N-acetylglucosamine deacetylase